MPLAVVYHKDYESAKKTFLLYHQLSFVRGLIYCILMILPFFEVSDEVSFEGMYTGGFIGLEFHYSLRNILISVICNLLVRVNCGHIRVERTHA